MYSYGSDKVQRARYREGTLLPNANAFYMLLYRPTMLSSYVLYLFLYVFPGVTRNSPAFVEEPFSHYTTLTGHPVSPSGE